MKKILALTVAALLLVGSTLRADEGMWLLPLLDKLNIKDMKKAGLKLSAEDIYSINKSSLKDAVVHFGGGCTGEMISKEGLLLTNHHCGYAQIQQHSSVEHDYLQDGFWAMSRGEELKCPGLTVTFLQSVEDVTARILPELNKTGTEEERAKRFSELSKEIIDTYPKDEFTRVIITPLYSGNMYYLFISKVYKDVRLVGAPPSSIGKFGADSDNWMWPRHTGDFSLFRVYADANGNPANPSDSNVPFKPKNYFKISLKGFQEGDYAMVIGYPGRTFRYMTSPELTEMVKMNEARITIRGARQDVWMKDMQADQKVRIQYSNKYAGSSNYWKNSIGMNEALAKLDVVNTRKQGEDTFKKWTGTTAQRSEAYGQALDLIAQAVSQREKARLSTLILSESLGRTEIFSAAAGLGIGIYTAYKEDKPQELTKAIEIAKERAKNFYKDYSVITDQKTAQVIFPLYMEMSDKSSRPDFFDAISKDYKGNIGWYITDLFANSIFASEEKLNQFLEQPSLDVLENDPAFVATLSIQEKGKELNKDIMPTTELYGKGVRMYMAGLLEMNQNKALYPDANSTMRVTYGNIKSYSPKDGVEYDYVTSLKGVMEKEDPDNWEFVVPAKLKELYTTKDYGQYGKNGKLPVNFIFNGDITGGNSGSPVINAKGELIGTAFDGNWEALSGDVLFEPELQRCINVDIRYTLFIIDKYANAKHLINEMTIVK